MNKYDQLWEERYELYNDLEKLQNVLPLVESQEAKEEIADKIYNIGQKREKLYKEAIEYQKKCPHPQWEYEGHDSHYSYEKCVRCSESRKM